MWAGVDLENFRAQTARCYFEVFFEVWSPTEPNLEELALWFLEPYENAGCSIQFNRKLSVRWRNTPLGGAKIANFFEMGNFKRPSLTHPTSYRHDIFTFATHIGALVDSQIVGCSLCNQGRYWQLNFEKSQKFVKVWVPLPDLWEEIQKVGRAKFLVLLLNKTRYLASTQL